MSSLGAALLERAVRAEAHAPAFPIAASHSAGIDEADIDLPEIGGFDLESASILGATFMIEYRDANGDETRRRITALDIRDDYLRARCHERQAMRSFRLDRILSVIDKQGVVFGTAEFFRLIDLPIENARPNPNRVFGAGARILSMIAYSDGWLHPDEVDKICQYCEIMCARHNISLSSKEIRAIEFIIENQYPTEIVAARCLSALDRMTPDDRKLLYRYAVQVMDADGIQHSAEWTLVEEIRQSL